MGLHEYINENSTGSSFHTRDPVTHPLGRLSPSLHFPASPEGVFCVPSRNPGPLVTGCCYALIACPLQSPIIALSPRAVPCLVTQSCLTLCDCIDCSPPSSSVHGDSPGKNTGVGCHALLQVIFPTQGLNSGLPRCSQILYHLSHQGSLVAMPSSSGSSQPRDQTQVSCIAGGFFTV